MPESLKPTNPVPRAPGESRKENISGSAGSEGVDLNIDFFSRARQEDGSAYDNNPIIGTDELDIDISSGQKLSEGDEDGEESDDDSSDGEGGEDSEAEEDGEEGEEAEGSDEEDVEEDASEDGEEAVEGAADDASVDAKKSKIKIGEKEYDIPNTSVIPTKANGKIENPTLQDLKNAYASKAGTEARIAEAKRVSEEAATERRRIIRERDKAAGDFAERSMKFDKVVEAVKNRDVSALITQAAMIAGVDAADFWDHIENEVFVPYYGGKGDKKGFSQLDQATQRALQLQRRTSLQTLQMNTLQQEQLNKEQNQKYQQFKESINEKFSISEDEVLDCWEGFESLARAGKLSKDQVESLKALSTEDKYKLAASEALAKRTRTRISSLVEKKFISLKNQAPNIAKELEDTMGIDFVLKATDENLAELINRVYAKNSSKKKVATTGKSTGKLSDKATPRHSVKKEAAPKTGDLDDESGLDDLDADIYSQERGRPSSQVWGGQFKI